MKKSLLLIATGIILGLPQLASAAPIQKPNGLTVSPAIRQVRLNKSQPSSSFTEHITNNTASEVVVSLGAQDFTSLNETGAIKFLGSNNSQSAHGLAKSIKFGISQFALAPGASRAIPATITNVGTLAPGGHYAAIIYNVHAPLAKGTQVSANEAVASLIFLTTAGQGTESIRLEPMPWNSFTTTIPTAANVVFINTGNIQTVPHGLITVSDSAGREIARGIINPGSALFLPGTVRLFNVPLRVERRTLLPGRYHVRVQYQPDAGTTKVYTKSFYFMPLPLLVVIVLVLVAVLIGVLRKRWLRAARRYRLKAAKR